MLDVNYFDQLRIGLATAEEIRSWSHGEVKKPETINYRTLKPERDGLFCEKIFGPTRDWECYCGKYKRVRFKGIICERCGVEVTRAKVRRERMGHVELAAPVTHIWYFKGVPSRLGYLLDLAPKDLEKVIYFAAHMITEVDEEGRHGALPSLEARLGEEIARIEGRRDNDINIRLAKLEEDLAALEAEGARSDSKRKVKDAAEREMRQIRKRVGDRVDFLRRVFDRFKTLKVQDLEGEEALYREMSDRYGKWFSGDMGAAAIKKRLETFDLAGESEHLRQVVREGSGARKTRALKRLKVVTAFMKTTNSPLGMVLDAVPVIPPDLRPMVQLDGGRFATSDLNDLYRRVINRNNRLKRLIDLGAPEIIVNNEKRMLQEAVDALFDNGRRGRPVTGPGNRALKSLSDMLKGKQGRFRQNLLGKRVDYSGRSVIVSGPQLKLHQCGLPKQMALELFKPFAMKRLVELGHSQNIKAAKRRVERAPGGGHAYADVWAVLEEVIAGHPVMLNRAPTLHRLGIQAFEPQLIEGKAIQIHPLVCTAFNADFDGDQMAVHLPLSPEAQAEARILMLSSNNILSPANGRAITTPTQDMVLGIYFLTCEDKGGKGEGRAFAAPAEALMAFDNGDLSLGAKIKLRLFDQAPPEGYESEGWQLGDPFILETTLGRALFNDALPADFAFVNIDVNKKVLGGLVNSLAERYPKSEIAGALDRLKELGFYWATRSGVTISIADVVTPKAKAKVLAKAEQASAKIDAKVALGGITESERREELIKIWTRATDEVDKAMRDAFPENNSISKMVVSGARGNYMQVRQIAGMRGLVANPKGETIARPIKSNFREGLSVLEYFISTHGARKGLADTALRTADSGYLTRRLVDVSQDLIVRDLDCETKASLEIPIAEDGQTVENAASSVASRTLAKAVEVDGAVLAIAGQEITMPMIREFVAAGVTSLRVRSVLHCRSSYGICATCYGQSLAHGHLVDVGEAVGIVAAQSIGEPGTQLTMRTFHTGGVVGDDITQGLPRVVELFEARTPKGHAPISEAAGVVEIRDTEKTRKIVVHPDGDALEVAQAVSKRSDLLVEDGQRVEVGTQLVKGVVDPKQVLRVLGQRTAQSHLVDEVQKVYRSQGVSIHDKHIEVIIRQMLRRVTIIDSGDSSFLAGELVDRGIFDAENRRVLQDGGQPASGRPELMGITKASLATESWLSAASFQETTRVLTDAAIKAKTDNLLGLKENVILGKLIPAGTGMPQYRHMRVEPTEAAKEAMYPSFTTYDDLTYSEGFDDATGASVPLEGFDVSGGGYYRD
ncbi:MAG: DNA-directed RNA polymerase subunit beta' [Candidatus Nanopelagicales bacterium]|nr:DNA-directed RNA polymerase subunit beta' [Candidatus Nanopelagicales bacterium]